MKTETKTENRAMEQAKAQLKSIEEMIARLHAAIEAGKDDEYDAIREEICEDALSVRVRSDWHVPGETVEPAEFEILLCTGGPAVRIVGSLNDYNEPDTAYLQYQDWYMPWEEFCTTEEEENALLEYARHYYFGD